MFASLYLTACAEPASLMELALEFSPVVEQTAHTTVTFSIDPLRKLIGSPHQIASEIAHAGFVRKLQANLAIASDPDTAVLLAHNLSGMTLITPGDEAHKLAALPLAALFTHERPIDKALLEVLYRWGLKSCADLAALPERGVAERLGPSGVYLRNLACGTIQRPLRVPHDTTKYTEHLELEHPLNLLEPLLFLLGRATSELCGRLRAQSKSARSLTAELALEEKKSYRCELEFPVPLDDSRTILKLLQLHLERHSPEAAIVAFTLRIDPVDPRRVQGGIFLPPTPAPDKLQVTLARIASMVGRENVGVPMLLDTHRPDAFTMRSTLPATPATQARHLPGSDDSADETPAVLPVAMRLFRPALPARVRVIECLPRNVLATGVRGAVVRSAGPWKTSGEWWTSTCWTHEEWDVALDDGALYRIYQNARNGAWFVQGVYD